MKSRLILIAFAAVFLLIQLHLWFANNGLLTVFQLKKMIALQEEKNSALKRDNDNLVAEIHELKNGGNAIEEHARKDLGMVREGEAYYRVVY